MSTYLKAFVTTTLLLTISGTALADNNMYKKERPMEQPLFSAIDVNADGNIELDEFSSYKPPRENYKTIFSHIDSDENGVISEEEYENHKPPKKRERKGHHHD